MGKFKIKTNKAAAKRFRVTGKGKVKREHAFASHILTKKSAKRRRRLRHGALVSKREERTIKMLLPYQ
ncbi:MAG: 50S ribosomal protein L35 [bacterium]|nr:50S ribosomal protein L35 [bacterium]